MFKVAILVHYILFSGSRPNKTDMELLLLFFVTLKPRAE